MWTFPKRHPRRGILLLIALALLVLFGLITLTFVLIAGHHYRGARAQQNLSDQQAADPALLIDQGIEQVLRGSQYPASALQIHSLLEDKYGNGAVRGRIVPSAPSLPAVWSRCSTKLDTGAIVEIRVALLDASNNPLPNFTPLDYVGRVITFTTGVSQGTSRRIIGYNAATNALQIPLGDWVSLFGKDGKPGTAKVDDDKNSTTDDDSELGWRTSDDQLRAYDEFVINGPDFAGTGFGYNAGSGTLDAVDGNGRAVALLPNVKPPYGDPAAAGGANEDYDAPDYQNMLLAQVNDDGTVAIPSLHRPDLVRYWIRANNPSGTYSTPADWLTAFKALPADLQHQIVLRPLKNATGHPKFITGDVATDDKFNPAWDGVTGTDYAWDVDNDKDGKPDSVWVDLGVPPIDYDGKKYKPLYAILCVDLDGRLNLNAHGALAQADPAYYGGVSAPVRNGVASYFAGGGTTSSLLSRTIGFGPADINLGPLFGNGDLAGNGTLQTAYLNLLSRRYAGKDTNGKDDNTLPGVTGPDFLSQNLQSRYFNPLWRSPQFFNLPTGWTYDYWRYWSDPSLYQPNAYGSPIDLKAKGAIGLDKRGQPLYANMSDSGDDYDHPYEADLLRTSDSDNVFSVAELEWLLRKHDSDADQLPQSLKTLIADVTGHTTNLANELTTQSWDVPTPGMRLDGDLRAQMVNTWAGLTPTTQAALQAQLKGSLDPTSPKANLVDLLIVRLAKGLEQAGIPPAAIPADVAKLLPRLLPIELGMGLKINLNRPFGNGLDDNGNGVADEPALLRRAANGKPFVFDTNHPGEIWSAKGYEAMPQYDAKGNAISAGYLDLVNGVDVNALQGLDLNGDGLVDAADVALASVTNRTQARQLYARQLYVLMLLLTKYQVQNPGSPTQAAAPTQVEQDEARLIAQWAVNAVDYQDSDSIMTPFEYDICPFTDKGDGLGNPTGSTWNVDGCIDADPSSELKTDDNKPYRGLVWGCERPALLLAETLALHDRRTEDLDTDPSGKKVADGDVDFDQRFRPEGSLFVELYNPGTKQEPLPAELSKNNLGVDLAKLSEGTAAASRFPVWRLAIVTREDGDKNPDDLTSPVTLDRLVYFVDPSGDPKIAPLPSDHLSASSPAPFHPSSALQGMISPIEPGRYALIGPGEPGSTGPSATYLGYRTDGSHGNTDTRRIELNPGQTSPSYIAPSVAVFGTEDGTGTTVEDDLSKVTIQAVTPVIVSEPLRLNLTMPKDGYPANDAGGTAYDPVAGYATPFDHPLDSTATPSLWNASYVQLKDNGIFPKARVIHLQRLANPLLPYHARTNPYLTIDTMVVDIHAYNGITTQKDLGSAVAETGTLDNFIARQRGETTSLVPTEPNLWTQEPLEAPTTPPVALGSATLASHHLVPAPFYHTLGYLNKPFGEPEPTPAGDPPHPFPWLRWANRPLVTPMELLEVPALDSRSLLRNPADVAKSPATEYPFGKTFAVLPGGTPNPYQNEGDSFPHLLNFAFSNATGSLGGASGCTPGELARIFDLVEVPSPFPQENTQGDAAQFSVAASTGHTFFTPFNQIPNYRKPGLVNLNTIASPAVWQGLLNYFPNMQTNNPTPAGWAEFLKSRRGYGDPPVDPSLYPSAFANPFRSETSAGLRPPLATSGTWPAPHGPIDATLLRPTLGVNTTPLFENASANEVNNTNRNPYFRHEVVERLSNLTTTRSNLYAVWITMGFFEVTPWPLESGAPTPDAQHPDGWQLGAEADTATTTLGRHRSFYILDRTIPVGFQRGVQLNSDKAILLRRTIE